MKIFTAPGFKGSGPSHWQTKWEAKYGFVRVEQDNWNFPVFVRWEMALLRYLNKFCQGNDAVFIAHSLGCHLILKSLPRISNQVKGIFLVAPPDLKSPLLGKGFPDFDGFSNAIIDVPGYLVYSENDPYASKEYFEMLIRKTGLQPFNIGHLGHVNSDSNIGDWEEGYTLFKQFFQSLHAAESAIKEHQHDYNSVQELSSS